MSKTIIPKTFTQMLREEDAYARRKVLGEVLSFDKCVTEIPEGIDLTTKYRVVGLTMVRHYGQQVKLAHGAEFRLNRYGPDAVREWIKHQDLHIELVDAPPAQDMKPFYEYAKSQTQIVQLTPEEVAKTTKHLGYTNNDAESCDKAPGVPVDASKEPDVSEPSDAKRKPGRPPRDTSIKNPFAPKKK
jgi:hypothetical protein